MLGIEERNRLADGLVDGFIEAQHVGEVRGLGLTARTHNPSTEARNARYSAAI